MATKPIQFRMFAEGSDNDTPKNWDITRKGLESMSYFGLESIFYGIRNIRVPPEMLNVQNPDEILAVYAGVGVLKKGNNHLEGEQSYDFLQTVGNIQKKGYALIQPFPSECTKRFSDKRGDQIQRLAGLEEYIREEFILSYMRDYLPSKRENPTNPRAFYDPNIDARSTGPIAMRVYERGIYSMIKSIWKNRI